MNQTRLALLLLGIVGSPALARDYDAVTWAPVATVTLIDGETTEVLPTGAVGQYLRFTIPARCGSVGFSLSGDGVPFTPRLIYDQNAVVWTPTYKRLFFWVRQEQNVAFSALWLEAARVEAGVCDVAIDVGAGEDPDPLDPTRPRVFAEGAATSDVAEYVAIELAWNRTNAAAQQLCGSPRVKKVPGQGDCSASATGNHWRAQCSAWFYCLTF